MKATAPTVLPRRPRSFGDLLFDRQMRSSLAILVTSLLATAFAWHFERSALEKADRDRFDIVTEALTIETKKNLASLGQTLRSGAGLLIASDLVTSNEWQRFTSLLSSATPVRRSDFFGYFAVVENADELKSLNDKTALTSPPRFDLISAPETYPAALLMFVKPTASNPASHTPLTSTLTKAALSRASENNGLALVNIETSMFDATATDKTPRAALMFPVFERSIDASTQNADDKQLNSLEGIFVSEFCLKDFAQDVLNFSASVLRDSVTLSIYDPQSPPPPAQKVYSGRGEWHLPTARHKRLVHLNAAGQPLVLEFSSTAQFDRSRSALVPGVVLAAGVASSLLLSALIWAINRRKTEAIAGEQRLMAMLNASIDAVIVTSATYRIAIFSDGAIKTFGYDASEILGRNINLLIPDRNRTFYERYLEHFSQTSQPSSKLSEPELLIARHKSGREFPVEGAISKVGDGLDRIYTIVLRDISERKKHENTIGFLTQEIKHRSKNMAGLILVIARETAGSEPVEFVDSFSKRVAALAACYDLFTRNGWHSIQLEALIRSQVAHFRDGDPSRIYLTGPDVRINADAAQSIGMAIYELTTNASKYGSLTVATGTVEISWNMKSNIHCEDQFQMTWVERGGPPVSPPTRSGFGTTIVKSMLEYALEAEIAIDYSNTGLVWRLTCKSDQLVDCSEPDDLLVQL